MKAYESEVNEMKKELLDSFEFAKTLNSDYSLESFIEVLQTELKKMRIRFNAIQRSGSHPDDVLRIGILSHQELISDLGETK